MFLLHLFDELWYVRIRYTAAYMFCLWKDKWSHEQFASFVLIVYFLFWFCMYISHQCNLYSFESSLNKAIVWSINKTVVSHLVLQRQRFIDYQPAHSRAHVQCLITCQQQLVNKVQNSNYSFLRRVRGFELMIRRFNSKFACLVDIRAPQLTVRTALSSWITRLISVRFRWWQSYVLKHV